MFGTTGEAGLCLTCVFCRCLDQQEKLACVSRVCCASVWSNRRSWPVSHLCVVQVFGATGEADLCLTCVLCRCLEQQEKRAVLLRVFRTAGEAGVLLSMPLVHLSPTCPVCFAGVQGTRSSKLTCVTSVPCVFFRCSEHQEKLTVYCWTCKECTCHQCGLCVLQMVRAPDVFSLPVSPMFFSLQVFGAPGVLSLPVSPVVVFSGVWSTRSSKLTCVTSVFCRCSELQEF